VTGEPVPSWVLGLDPDPDERGPPREWDLVDPPAPEMWTRSRRDRSRLCFNLYGCAEVCAKGAWEECAQRCERWSSTGAGSRRGGSGRSGGWARYAQHEALWDVSEAIPCFCAWLPRPWRWRRRSAAPAHEVADPGPRSGW